MTSSSVSNLKSGANGPKVSSLATAISFVTPVRIVGSKKLNPLECGLPPLSTFAPLLVASAICSSTFATAFVSISGPCVVPDSKPLPTCSFSTSCFRACATLS